MENSFVKVLLPKYTRAEVLGIFKEFCEEHGLSHTANSIVMEARTKNIRVDLPPRRPMPLEQHVEICSVQLTNESYKIHKDRVRDNNICNRPKKHEERNPRVRSRSPSRHKSNNISDGEIDG
eukprot:gene19611-26294_t